MTKSPNDRDVSDCNWHAFETSGKYYVFNTTSRILLSEEVDREFYHFLERLRTNPDIPVAERFASVFDKLDLARPARWKTEETGVETGKLKDKRIRGKRFGH